MHQSITKYVDALNQYAHQYAQPIKAFDQQFEIIIYKIYLIA